MSEELKSCQRRYDLFRSYVVVGDGNGHIGYGLGKAGEVDAVTKATDSPKALVKVRFTRKPYHILIR